MTLIKANIIGAVSDRTGFSKKKSRHTINTLIEIIKSTLKTDMVGAILTNIKLDFEIQLNLPKPVFDKYWQTFRVLEWSPALAVSS